MTESNADTTRSNDNESTTAVSRRAFLAASGAIAASGTAAAETTTESASTEWTDGRGGLNFDSDYVPNSEFAEDTLTRDRHKLKWGTGKDALAYYVDDNGKKAELGGYVPTDDTENVLTVRADKFAAPDLYDFPRNTTADFDSDDEDEVVRALDATHWTTSSGSNSSVSVSDADANVPHAITIDATVASGETATATFDLSQFGATIEDSVAKRYLAGVANLSLNSGTTVEIAAVDDDGDDKKLLADPSGDATTTDTFAAQSGNGFAFQERMGDLGTTGSGDGNFDSIQKIEVRVLDANATVTLTALNAEKMSEWTFGSFLQNEGTDSEERVDHVRPGPGTFQITGFDTLSSALKSDDAVVYDVSHPFRYTMSAGNGDFEYRFIEATDYSGYKWRLQLRGKRKIPSGYELSHTGIEWIDDVTAPANRYVDVWTATGIENTDFEDIDDTAKTSHAGSYDSRGATVTLKSSATADTVYGFGADILVTGSNKDDATDSGGGGVPPAEKSGGNGLLAVLMSLVGGTGIAVFLRKVL